MCICLYLDFTLFEINIILIKKHLSIPRTNIFWKIQLTPIQYFPRLISMPKTVDCDPQAVVGVS